MYPLGRESGSLAFRRRQDDARRFRQPGTPGSWPSARRRPGGRLRRGRRGRRHAAPCTPRCRPGGRDSRAAGSSGRCGAPLIRLYRKPAELQVEQAGTGAETAEDSSATGEKRPARSCLPGGRTGTGSTGSPRPRRGIPRSAARRSEQIPPGQTWNLWVRWRISPACKLRCAWKKFGYRSCDWSIASRKSSWQSTISRKRNCDGRPPPSSSIATR